VSDTAAIVAAAAGVDTTALCDVRKDLRVMSPALRCRSRNPVLVGPAVTVRCRDDLLGVISAIDAARPGEVVVVDGGGRETALAGELFARAAQARGLVGLIVDGGYRDLRYVAGCDLPVYSRHVTPVAGTAVRPATVNEVVSCGGVRVAPGDIVVGDHDGLVVLDPATALDDLAAARAVMATEVEVARRLGDGVSLGDCVDLTGHIGRLRRGEPSTLRFTV
jgi:regulator of RNase E activity RraA